VRFTGGAIAPFLAGKLAEHVSAASPMYVGAGMVALSVVALVLSRRHLRHEAPAVLEPTTPGAVLVAIDSGDSGAILDTAGRVASARGTAVHVVHVRETRVFAGEVAALETDDEAQAIVDAALTRLNGTPKSGEVIDVLGHHGDAAEAILELANAMHPAAIVAGRAAGHGGELGAPSLTTVLVEHAPCDVVAVAALT
jgi:MFS transporter, ACDE family, multidrug resistance protein